MSKYLIISGAPSTGKSSLIQKLRSTYPQLDESCMFITDGGRWWMEKWKKETGKKGKIEDLSKQERALMQWDIFIYYRDHVENARRLGKTIVADAFYAEVLAYSLDCLDSEQINKIEHHLYEYEDNIRVVVLPIAQLPLERDGLRHQEEEFRKEVEKRILTIYKKYHIPFIELHTSHLDERVEAIAKILF